MKFVGNDIRSQRFQSKLRGYDRLEVDAFLFKVADSLDESVRKNEQLSLQCKDIFEQYNRLREEHANLQKILISVNELKDQATAKSDELVEKAGNRRRGDRQEGERRGRGDSRESRKGKRKAYARRVLDIKDLRDKLLMELYETFLSQIRTLEIEGVRNGGRPPPASLMRKAKTLPKRKAKTSSR